MSGFAGIVRLGGRDRRSSADRKSIERIAQRLAFRGPDATQVWSEGGANFCFTLLRTGPSPQAEAQPCTLDRRTWLLGDVRLDERDDLIRKLREQGKHCNPATSNEELVLLARQLCEERGQRRGFRESLRGEFGFALWCPEQGKIQCFRDLMGSRPFFYFQAEDTFCFSNTLEALRDFPDVSDELDYGYLGDFLLASWCADAGRTVYREVRRLPAGHELVFSEDGVRLERFDELPIEEPLHLKRSEDYIEQYRAILTKAVRERLPKSGAVVFLSGGLDSSTVAATAAKILKEGDAPAGLLHAHTLDCQPLFDDREGEYAAKVAKHLGIPVQIMHTGYCTPFSGWDSLELPLPEPRNDPFLALRVQRYEPVARQARIVLSGDGGDDILGGKAWPYLLYLLGQFRIGTLLGSFGGYLLRNRKVPPLGTGIRSLLRQWSRRDQEAEEYPDWLNPEFEKAYRLKERWKELQESPKSAHPLHPRAHGGLSSPFWPSLLEQEDAAWSGAAVEYRAPMLDRRVLAFLLRLPPVPWCCDKELLRRSAKDQLPDEIRLRPKTPLEKDPLELHIAQGNWSPVPLLPPSPRMLDLVDWGKWSVTLTRWNGPAAWIQLCPLSLNLWLKRVEKTAPIQ